MNYLRVRLEQHAREFGHSTRTSQLVKDLREAAAQLAPAPSKCATCNDKGFIATTEGEAGAYYQAARPCPDCAPSAPLRARILEIADGCELAAKRMSALTGNDRLDRERRGMVEAYCDTGRRLRVALEKETG